MKLETQRLNLRPITLDDKNEMSEYRCDKVTNKYQGWIPETIDNVETFIGKIAKHIIVHLDG